MSWLAVAAYRLHGSRFRYSDSPRDPLNFGKWRKVGILVTVAWFSTMALSVVGGFGSLAPIFFGIYGKRQYSFTGVSR